jgi:F0F1-type ATP synthase membrane subunit a
MYRAIMRPIARMLQLAGLTIPPLAMCAQLTGNISAGKMLQFLVAAVCLFSFGYLLQTYGGGRS